MNGIIEKDEDGQDRLRIFCDEAREHAIRDFIKQRCPELIFVLDRVEFKDGVRGYARLIA